MKNMSDDAPGWTSEISSVISDPLKFKKKLNIGEDAYKSLRVKKYLLEALNAGGGVATGVGLAQAPIVAGTFFAPTGIAAFFGFGVAVTPVGWAVAAGVVGAGLSVALGKYFVRKNPGKVTVIPEFINTPLDLLAVCLMDYIGSLSFKIAAVDGDVHSKEVSRITEYFTEEWGYDSIFVSKALDEIRMNCEGISLKDIATKLADFKKKNDDCNYAAMSKEILEYLREITEADGYLDEREEAALQAVEAIFVEFGSVSVSRSFDQFVEGAKTKLKKGHNSKKSHREDM